jgi:hypothetical protein
MTRQEALDRLRLEQVGEPPVLAEVLREWDMTADEIAWDAEWCG